MKRVIIAMSVVLMLAMTSSQAALAQSGSTIETVELQTKLVPSPGRYTVLLPPGYAADKGPYPLVLLLHGGDGYNGFLAGLQSTIEAAWAAGDLPPAVIVTPDAKRSFYVDYRDGSERWESFIIEQVIPDVRRRFRLSTERSKTVVEGVSMGGMGALRLGFDHPEMFGGLASLEAGIEPALSFRAVKLRNRFYRDDALLTSIYGKPVDEEFWQRSNPANMAIDRRDKIIASGLQIYIDVGDKDMLHLDEGIEFLHRVLWDHGIPHEYRQVHDANHVGRSLPGRFRDGFRFLTLHVLEPLPPDASIAPFQALVDGLKRTAGFSDKEPRPPLPPTSH